MRHRDLPKKKIWIEGDEIRFNGHRLNLMGTSINTHGQGFNRDRYEFITPETWNRTIDRLQYLNIQCVRFHQQPPSKRIIEIADDFSGEGVQVEVRLESTGKVLAMDIKNMKLPLGEHRDISCEFRVPNVENELLNLVLVTRKGGHLRFEECKKFKISGDAGVSEAGDAYIKIAKEDFND